MEMTTVRTARTNADKRGRTRRPPGFIGMD
jgi:hypothetical protein